MPAETLLLSAVHPSTHNCKASTSNSSQWSIAAQQVLLDRSDKHPMAVLVPGLRLQLHYAGAQDRPAYSHIMSCSVPLATCFKDILGTNVHTPRRSTLEDGMQYQVDVVADTQGMSIGNVQQLASEFQQGLDVLLHHQSLVASSLGLSALKTVDELVTEVAASKQERDTAVAAVLSQLATGTQEARMLNLQYGRAFNMQVDQQQCRALREGSVLADGFSQTLLHTSIAQAGLIAKLAQEAGVPTEDPVLVQRVLENFVNTHGVQALAHLLHEHVQLGYCCRTAYQFDPTFAPGTQVTRAVQNSDGSTALTVVPQLAMQATPGEDQNLTPGMHYADVAGFANTAGLMRRDCEDGAHALNTSTDLMRCVPLNTLLQAQARVLTLLPADVQRVGNSILYVSSQLHAHAQLPAVDVPVTPLANVNTQVLVAASAAPRTFKPSLYATSLLAAAPQLSSSLGGSSLEPLAKPDCTSQEYYSWWTGALSQGDSSAHLSGHSVSMTLGLAPLLSTAVGQTRVDVHLLDRNIRVYESTALARQVFASDTAAVKLNLNKAPVTPVRRNLQQQLDNSAPLTMCMACNLRSTLHAAETQNMISQAVDSEAMLSAIHTGTGKQIFTPSLVPMQAFSLNTEGTTQEELSRQLRYTFYKTLLACGEGLVYTVDHNATAAFAGMPMCRQLSNTHSIVLGSPLPEAERKKLHVLGALQSLFVLSAEQAIGNLPPFMPLALQQRMQMCPVRQQLAPLAPADLSQATHACGILAQTGMLALSDEHSIVGNMHAVHDAVQQVVGPHLHVTGGPFADTLTFSFL